MPVVTESPATVQEPAPALSPPELSPPTYLFAPPVEGLYRLSLDEYHRMAEAGVLADTRVELIDGMLFKKTTKNTPHIIATGNLNAIFHAVKPQAWFVLIGGPITLPGPANEPEPDAMLVRGRTSDYRGPRIGPGDVGLVVEVSDTSLHEDHAVKKPL